MARNSTGFVLAVDVGTTNLTCHVFDNSGISKYGATRKVRDTLSCSFTLYALGINQICQIVFFYLLACDTVSI